MAPCQPTVPSLFTQRWHLLSWPLALMATCSHGHLLSWPLALKLDFDKNKISYTALIKLAKRDKVCIAFTHIFADEKKESAIAFLEAVTTPYKAFRITIKCVMRDNIRLYVKGFSKDVQRAWHQTYPNTPIRRAFVS